MPTPIKTINLKDPMPSAPAARTRCRGALILLAVAALAGRATAQTPYAPPPSVQATGREPFTWSASAYTYLVPNQANYLLPILTGDRGALHLEGRYNYEAIDAASTWVGYNLSTGDDLTLDFTAMVGGVFGSTTGVVLGYEGTLSWRKLELYSEGEYLFDVEDPAGNFFYNWSQLSYAPAKWVFFGVVTQRTRVYDTERDLNRGPFLGFAYKTVNLTTFVINPDDEEATVIVAVEVGF
jgi:hypothetical protein